MSDKPDNQKSLLIPDKSDKSDKPDKSDKFVELDNKASNVRQTNLTSQIYQQARKACKLITSLTSERSWENLLT